MCILDFIINGSSSKSNEDINHIKNIAQTSTKHIIYFNENISMMEKGQMSELIMNSPNRKREWEAKTATCEFSSDDRERTSGEEDNEDISSTCTLCTSSFSFCNASPPRSFKNSFFSDSLEGDYANHAFRKVNTAKKLDYMKSHHDQHAELYNGSRVNSSSIESLAHDRNLGLHYASARGCIECVQMILDSSQEISANTQMDNDVTPVYLAAQEGHLDVLKFLVESGGSLYVRAKDGMTALHAASQMNRLDVLKWMVEEQRVDPNLRDGDGATPLHFAASRGHLSVVKWLLNHGAKLSLDKYGKSPINDAAENQQTECLNVLVQHSSDYKSRHTSSKSEKYSLKNHSSFMSKCSTASSDSEPFYLHPPSNRPAKEYTRSSPDGGYYGALPNDGIFINPMRANFTPTSPSDSGESFFLHDPQEVIYNRVKDIFESDASVREEPVNRSNAMTVQAEIHSSSSGAASGSDDDITEAVNLSKKPNVAEAKAPTVSNNHDYEDIYLVREEAKASSKKFYGRSRSRTDSGSHSRSASTSSTRSRDVVMHSGNVHYDKNNRYEVPRKSIDQSFTSQTHQNPSMNADTTYESVGPSDNIYERKNSNTSNNVSKTITSPIDAPPLPPPLPPPLMKNHHNVTRNANRDSSDSLADSIDFSHADADACSLESDSGLEVVEEPTLRPSELVRGNNNRSMSIISANKKSKLINNTSEECGFNTNKSHQHRQQNEPLNTKKTKASGKVHQQQTGASTAHSSVDAQHHSNQEHDTLYNGFSNDSKRGPNLVNKQLVLPIIAFPNSVANDSNHLIKPSEYLRSIVSVTDKRPSQRSTDSDDYATVDLEQTVVLNDTLAANSSATSQEENSSSIPIPPPAPPILFSNTVNRNSTSQPTQDSTINKKQHQPLSSISIQDLNSVQLRRTDNKMLSKTFSAPTRSISMQCLTSTNEQFLSQKIDLIAELKMSKDITGIKKMKVERAKMDRNSEIPDRDSFGNIIPDWKRQMLAKKAADKAKKEFEDRLAREAEDRRLSAIPKWKRDLIARKEEAESKMKNNTTQRNDNSHTTDTWRTKMSQRAMSIDNISFLSPPISRPLQYDYDKDFDCNDSRVDHAENTENLTEYVESNEHAHTTRFGAEDFDNEEDNNIIPWKKLLRKTNSRLNLIS